MDVITALAQDSDLYNNGDFEHSIKCFEEVADKCTSDSDKKTLSMFLPLKLRCYLQLQKTDVLVAELTQALNTYADDIPTQAKLIAALHQFQMEKVLLGVTFPTRFIYGQQSSIALKHQLFDIALSSTEKYESLPADRHEYEIYFTDLNQCRHCFAPEHIAQYQIETLPNDNVYISMHLEKEDLRIVASLPGPSNDAICESGHITIAQSGTKQSSEVNRENVTLAKIWGPYHLQAKTEFGVISILNTNLAGQQSNE